MAAASSFGEPWEQREKFHKRLSFQHRNYAGRRHSDHVAILGAFQHWSEAAARGEVAEAALCEVGGGDRSSFIPSKPYSDNF